MFCQANGILWYLLLYLACPKVCGIKRVTEVNDEDSFEQEKVRVNAECFGDDGWEEDRTYVVILKSPLILKRTILKRQESDYKE